MRVKPLVRGGQALHSPVLLQNIAHHCLKGTLGTVSTQHRLGEREDKEVRGEGRAPNTDWERERGQGGEGEGKSTQHGLGERERTRR